MKIIVTGGRTYFNKGILNMELDKQKPTMIIEGGALGADLLAHLYAEDKGIPNKTYKANWEDLSQPNARIKVRWDGKKYDANAGHRRNKKMLEENLDATVVAFPGGHGTADCVKTARELGMKVILVDTQHNSDL